MTDSAFAVRGVIEGFYGTPWSHEQRLSLLGFLGARGFNTFIYAPKDDALVRHEWRASYQGEELARLGELIAGCAEAGLDFVYCLSPGLSIEYSSAEDRRVLSSKFASVAALGVTSFGLLLDDIPARLQHPSDRAAFSSLVEAQLALVGEVFEGITSLGGDARLTVCPTQYWGYGDEEYIATLGAGLDPRIELFWTGRAICSATLDVHDAEVFTRATGRPPTYWDNYPVNDVAMTNELHVGPYRGRATALHEHSRGIVANGMELFEASKIAFATIGDYLNDPAGYDPESSWRAAIEAVAGDNAAAYALFADNVRSSCLAADDAPLLQEALETFTFESQYGDAAGAADPLAALAERMLAAADELLRGPVANPGLITESRPWIEVFELGAHAVERIAALYREGRLESHAAELGHHLAALRATRLRVFGDVLDMTLAELAPAPQTTHHQ